MVVREAGECVFALGIALGMATVGAFVANNVHNTPTPTKREWPEAHAIPAPSKSGEKLELALGVAAVLAIGLGRGISVTGDFLANPRQF